MHAGEAGAVEADQHGKRHNLLCWRSVLRISQCAGLFGGDETADAAIVGAAQHAEAARQRPGRRVLLTGFCVEAAVSAG